MAVTATERKNASNAALATAGDLPGKAVEEISNGLRYLLADVFALYLKTKNFHWHMIGIHFRDYHLLLDDHGDQIFSMSDPVAERARKIGRTTLRSIGDIAKHQRIVDNDELDLTPTTMLHALYLDNRQLIASMRSLHELCDSFKDVATTSLIEMWLDETKRRAWFLGEIVRSLN
jgi:starvation-inducible DNA-binding protein